MLHGQVTPAMKTQDAWLSPSSSSKSPQRGIMALSIANPQTRHTHEQKRMQAHLPNTDIKRTETLGSGPTSGADLLRPRGSGHRRRRGR